MAEETMKMQITKDCFVSDKSVIMRDAKPVERRKVFKDEVHDLQIDDANLLDELGFAKIFNERVAVKKAVKADEKNPA